MEGEGMNTRHKSTRQASQQQQRKKRCSSSSHRESNMASKSYHDMYMLKIVFLYNELNRDEITMFFYNFIP